MIVYDELIHASVHDGMRLSKAERRAARHNDAESFDEVISDWRASGGVGQIWIAVESLYSMDGDRAPIDELKRIADRRDATLIIDEAHATGVFGPDGRGLAAHLEGAENVISLHTCGKALGVMGALILAPRSIRDFLVNRARPFIYATAPSPLVAALVRAALDITRRETRSARALASIDRACRPRTARSRRRRAVGIADPAGHCRRRRGSGGAGGRTEARGYDIRAIRPPTVPEGTARLRLAITLNVDEAAISGLIAAIAEARAEQRRHERATS